MELPEDKMQRESSSDPPHAMSSATSLALLKDQVTCPICVTYLRDPVTTECGHNFCHSCIFQCWEGLQDTFPCPLCLHYCPSNVLQSNTQLGHLVDIVMQMAGTQSQKSLCEQHREALDLFCNEDLKLLCAQCGFSPSHQDHHLMLIQEAAAVQKKKLKSYKKHLEKQVSDLKKECQRQDAICRVNIFKIQKWHKELQLEFENFQRFLSGGYTAIISGLGLEEKTIETQLFANTRNIKNHLSMMKCLLSEMTEKSLQADVDLLRDVKSLQERYSTMHIPTEVSYELQDNNPFPPHYVGLEKLISTFQVDLTFQPRGSHPILKVSRNEKAVTIVRELDDWCSTCPFSVTVETQETFQSGRSFWQVEVKGSGQWSLGVCQKPASEGTKCTCCGSGEQQFVHPIHSSRARRANRLGVFLDYELGEISFYDLESRNCLQVYRAEFTGILVPVFSISSHSTTFLSICFDSKE